MEFKDRIKNLRTESNLPYSQLATEFNKTEAAIRSWEMGRTKPDADTLIKLAKYFGCTTDYLLGLNEFRNVEEEKEKTESLNSLSVYVEGLPFEIKEKLYFVFQTFVNSYQRVEKHENIRIGYISFLEQIAEIIADTTIDIFFNFGQEGVNDVFISLGLNEYEKKCKVEIENLYVLLIDYFRKQVDGKYRKVFPKEGE